MDTTLMNHYDEDIEFASPAEQKLFQEDLLRQQLAYLQAHSPYYQRMFAEHQIDIASIRTIEDLQRLPFTEKKDLQLYNDDFLCCPKEQLIDYVTTSGTLGEPVVFGCSDHDLDRLAFNEYKSFRCAGVTKSSLVQLMTTLDKRFMAGMAYFNGLRRLGAGIIRVGNPDKYHKALPYAADDISVNGHRCVCYTLYHKFHTLPFHAQGHYSETSALSETGEGR